MINGFLWVGDYGYSSGQYGLAKGYVTNNGFSLGDNRTTGGNSAKFPGNPSGVPDNLKRVIYQSNPTSKTFVSENSQSIGNYRNFAISSSTSIVKDGICTTDTSISRWTAIGITSYMPPRVFFVSSTSGSTTNSVALCNILKSLGAYNALRMDGGPSAAFTIGATIKNPLTGLDYIKYGTSRYIPYGLRIGS